MSISFSYIKSGRRVLFFGLILLHSGLIAQDVIFLHHSTGRNVYYRGGVEEYIANYNDTSNVRLNLIEREYPDDPWPWKNYPYDYWKLWIDGACDSQNPNIECLTTIAETYDVIVFKHCFPGSAILEDTGIPETDTEVRTLENYKAQYRELLILLDSLNDTKFLIWTLPPLHRKATTPEQAQRAHQFVEWVKNEWLLEDGKPHDNIYIFDFFSLMAESDPNPEYGFQYCLKYEYEYNHDSDNSHPNTIADAYSGPLFAQRIIDVVNDRKLDSIKIKSSSPEDILFFKDSLTFSIEYYPENALHKKIEWELQNHTGQAEFSPGGALLPLNEGIVWVKATSAENEQIRDSLQIEIKKKKVESISIVAPSENPKIDKDDGQLKLDVVILPTDAYSKEIIWTVNDTSLADVDEQGNILAKRNGNVWVLCSATDGSKVQDSIKIEITNQYIPIDNISIIVSENDTLIDTPGDSISMQIKIVPSDASEPLIHWFVDDPFIASVDSTRGILTALSNGIVTVYAETVTVPPLIDSQKIHIINQPVPIESFTILSEPSDPVIYEKDGSLQLMVEIIPDDQKKKENIIWSIDNEEVAQLDSSLKLTALNNGIVKVVAILQDEYLLSDTLTVHITNQGEELEKIVISSENGDSIIDVPNGQLQLNISFSPSEAYAETIIWSVDDSLIASIDSSGLLTALSDGIVTVFAKTNNELLLVDSQKIVIINQYIPIESFTIISEPSDTMIDERGGSMQLLVEIIPFDQKKKENVIWSISNKEVAHLDSSLKLTALKDGIVKIIAELPGESLISDTLTIHITNQEILLENIRVFVESGDSIIENPGGQLQLLADFYPEGVEIPDIEWSINDTALATIDSSGLVTANLNGTIIAKAKSTANPEIEGELKIILQNQIIPLDSIEIMLRQKDNFSVDTHKGSLQFYIKTFPDSVTNNKYYWHIDDSSKAIINQNGFLTARKNGNVNVFAEAMDGSGIKDSVSVRITNQKIYPQGIEIVSTTKDTIINEPGGSIQLNAIIVPESYENKSVRWEVDDPLIAHCDSTGRITAISNGVVVVKACITDGSELCAAIKIYISNQTIPFESITALKE